MQKLWLHFSRSFWGHSMIIYGDARIVYSFHSVWIYELNFCPLPSFPVNSAVFQRCEWMREKFINQVRKIDKVDPSSQSPFFSFSILFSLCLIENIARHNPWINCAHILTLLLETKFYIYFSLLEQIKTRSGEMLKVRNGNVHQRKFNLWSKTTKESNATCDNKKKVRLPFYNVSLALERSERE